VVGHSILLGIIVVYSFRYVSSKGQNGKTGLRVGPARHLSMASALRTSKRMEIPQNEIGGHVARIGVGGVGTVFWWGNMRERSHV
jgi:hypothetical protein